MSDTEAPEEDAPKKKSRLPLVLGVALMLLLGGGGFFAVYSGMVLGSGGHETAEQEIPVEALPDIAFVPIEPIVVSLGKEPGGRYLHFTAQLEVAEAHQRDVLLILPRVLDVLNSYLRAVDVSDLEDPTALIRLRAQMLRRVQMVAGEGRIRDLLVTEFVIN